MSITIGSNLSSLRAQRQLASNSDLLSRGQERLSSGMRINRASDDAAGLSVSMSLTAQSRVYSQSLRNIQDGISAVNIADGALSSLSTILIRGQELAEQAANGSYSSAQRQALDTEAQALSQEYSRVIATTTFNGINLLDLTQPMTIEAGSTVSSHLLRVNTGFVSVAGVTTGINNGTFAARVSFSTGTNPYPLQVVDVNGDGNVDILTPDSGSSTFSLLLGNGNGTFKARSSFTTGGIPDGITTGDVNGDGNIDVIVGEFTPGTVGVFLGNGNGTFSARVTYKTGAGAFDPVVYDINNDSKLDIIVSNGQANDVSVLLGNGNGTFLAQTSFAVGIHPLHTTLHDLNQDGKMDVIVGDQGGSSVSVLLGLGNGTFSPAVSSYVGPAPTFALGDIDGDGITDLVSADYSGSTLCILIGNGNGTFKARVSFVVTSPQAVELFDANGDGKLDIIASTTSASIFWGNGNGTFKAPTSFATGGAPYVTVRDVNGDLIRDLVTSDNSSGSVSVLLGNGSTTTTPRYSSASIPSFTLTTVSGARSALTVFQSTLTELSQARGLLGSQLSRLEAAKNVVRITRENYISANSRIMDADIAEESGKVVRGNILQQAGASILAQANQQPQIGLKLLSGT